MHVESTKEIFLVMISMSARPDYIMPNHLYSLTLGHIHSYFTDILTTKIVVIVCAQKSVTIHYGATA